MVLVLENQWCDVMLNEVGENSGRPGSNIVKNGR